MRGDIAAALLHDPEVVYLDEPTIGLDIVSKAKVREFLRDLNRERGTTVLLTTHDLTDIEQLCSRVMVIDHGRVMYDGDLAGLHATVGGSERTLVVDLAEAGPPIEVAGARVVRGTARGSGWRSRRRTAPLPWWRRSPRATRRGPVDPGAGDRDGHRPDVRRRRGLWMSSA